MITNVKGVFNEFDASIYTTGEDFMTAEIDFWMNPASVDTNDAKRDGHLKSADFFDVENHKQITFLGDSVENVDNDGSYELYGNLTIKGITHKIKLDVEFGGVMRDPWGNEKAGFTINGKFNRKDRTQRAQSLRGLWAFSLFLRLPLPKRLRAGRRLNAL